MEVVYGSQAFPDSVLSPIVCMGNFDGVHSGHQILLQKTLEIAATQKGNACLYTFFPHPAQVLSRDAAPVLIQTLDQKIDFLSQFHLSFLIIEKFNAAFSELSPEAFFREIILDKLHPNTLIVGYDFTFGKHRTGNIESLKRMCTEQNIKLVVVEAQFQDKTLISSSHIRTLVAAGNISRANELLGHPYQIEGTVIKGRGMGGSLGAHTANIETENKLVPKNGVYLTRTSILENTKPLHRSYHLKEAPSISSVGWNPTFPGSPFSIETHFLKHNENILGKFIQIDFLERLRDQIKFESPAALKEQIAADIDEARQKHGL
ncbi:MAG: riboflavin biosynthesis protein RibF [Deltaproteobacteria bacterium CG_4_10_14_0_2_um_filter_43_8]|nr:MAG: riboflavin biosynthesis protein RibF [Deltaproteobacteria bacterium CG11_big_fil_rev_8_21_14_0_20_42_23]PJA22190.1 MAG: riboflavin biosynthesis protein RibF [Deltaproteobacteria bacterium CG_4_10_14_0_2_um_filter_43_8]PJC64456.1 MAG: riboflavin biosynthesis protein RibF [Deltaproteobacteria bacterium CG_4_9_14_0_2_um_filter_42_21]